MAGHDQCSIASECLARGYGFGMLPRMRRWSRWKRAGILVGAAVVSWVVSHALRVVSDSRAASLMVNLAVVAVMGWLGITFLRATLRDGEEEVRKDPRPW